ncbi:MAG: PepSY domain-containing protein [Lachnospiraceae bacterium]
MKKRQFILIALMVMTFGLTACGQANSPNNTAQQTAVPVNQDSLQNNQGGNNAVAVDTSDYIGEEKAMAIALEDAKVAQEDLLFSYVKLDFDDGRWMYDVEFYAGNKEYDYEIDATQGTILSFDFDMEENFTPNLTQNNNPGGANQNNNSGGVTIDAARETALAQVPGATADNIRIYTDYDDGRMIYEGKIIYNTMEYEFEIDANTGNITEWSAESIYD